MELQTRIEKLEASLNRQKLINIALASVIVAGVGVAAIQPAGDATFETITCKELRVIDKDGKLRIAAATLANGQAGLAWLDKDQKIRITAATNPDGSAAMGWLDKDGTARIAAETSADGQATLAWLDKDGKMRIFAATLADGTVVLPTSDLKPK